MSRAPLTVQVALLGLLVLSGCDSAPGLDEGPDPDAAVEALAEALVTGDFTDVAFASTTPEEVSATYEATVVGMETEPMVEPGEIEQDGDSATATLAWTWPVADEQWAYTSTATLTRSDDAWQVDWDVDLVEPSLAGATVLDITPVDAGRADITGAGGQKLVTPRPVIKVGIDRSLVPKARARDSARAVAELVGIDVAPYVQQVAAAGDLAFVEAISYRADEVPPAVGSGYEAIKGARLVGADVPLAPTRDFAAPILGTVGEVTAEMIEESPGVYEAGDQVGLSGLQLRYDEQLRGAGGIVVNAVGSDEKEREIFRTGGKQGTPLELTMDLGLQQAAEGLLAGVAPASALVAIQPSTGGILAAANGPGTEGLNIATFGQYAPGSTFKSVSTLALLRGGLTPDTAVTCSPTIVVDGKSFKNYSDYPAGGIGRIPLRTALANSCNTAFISERGRVDELGLFDAAAALGMGIDHDLGFPAYFGSVEPAPSETGRAADMIGQGTILASPMVMATVIASIQQGSLVVPRLLESVEVSPPDHTPLTTDEAAALREMLRGVVTSGSGAALADVPGDPVIAKTGTAEFQGRRGIETHAWMIAAQGDLAVAVFVEVGTSGSQTAGPILEAFLRAAG
ncbi:MAG: penicillin-binding transpeptidase domain-containing protein [Nocardioides sp.]